jgi:hypothetical protein
MAFEEQLFIGKISTFSPTYNFLVGFTGDTVNGQNTITNIVASDANNDLGLLRVGQTIVTYSGGGFSGNVIITNISGTTITVDTNSIFSQTGGLFATDTPAGTYFFNSASFFDPQNNLTVDNITGSNNVDYDATLSPEYAVVGQASVSLGGSAIPAKFHLYKITDVTYRNLGTSKISGYIAWGEQGVESDSGDALYAAANQTLAIGALSTTSSNVTIYDNGAITETPAGSSVAGYQIALPSIIDQAATGSVGVSFPYTGSAEITGSLSVTGSSTISLNTNEKFLINNATAVTQSLFQVNNEGVAIFRAREGVDGVPTPVVGGMYFTTSSAYIGVN